MNTDEVDSSLGCAMNVLSVKSWVACKVVTLEEEDRGGIIYYKNKTTMEHYQKGSRE